MTKSLAQERSRAAGVRWRVDPRRCHGEIATRHVLWGRRSAPLEAWDGELHADGPDIRTLAIELSAGTEAGKVRLSFHGQELRRVDCARLHGFGVLRMDTRAEPVTFLIHDLGGSLDPVYGERRFLTLRARLPARSWRRQVRGLWHPLILGRDLELFGHLEWLPAGTVEDGTMAETTGRVPAPRAAVAHGVTNPVRATL